MFNLLVCMPGSIHSSGGMPGSPSGLIWVCLVVYTLSWGMPGSILIIESVCACQCFVSMKTGMLGSI